MKYGTQFLAWKEIHFRTKAYSKEASCKFFGPLSQHTGCITTQELAHIPTTEIDFFYCVSQFVQTKQI